jgi:hypothetical protein
MDCQLAMYAKYHKCRFLSKHGSPSPSLAAGAARLKSITSGAGRRFVLLRGGLRPSRGYIAIMKTALAILVLGSFALAADGARAYQSRANGYQSYPNYDRQEYVNRSCCSWKTNHQAPHKLVKR